MVSISQDGQPNPEAIRRMQLPMVSRLLPKRTSTNDHTVNGLIGGLGGRYSSSASPTIPTKPFTSLITEIVSTMRQAKFCATTWTAWHGSRSANLAGPDPRHRNRLREPSSCPRASPRGPQPSSCGTRGSSSRSCLQRNPWRALGCFAQGVVSATPPRAPPCSPAVQGIRADRVIPRPDQQVDDQPDHGACPAGAPSAISRVSTWGSSRWSTLSCWRQRSYSSA